MYKALSEEIRYVEESGPAVLRPAEGIGPRGGVFLPFFLPFPRFIERSCDRCEFGGYAGITRLAAMAINSQSW